MTTSSELNKFLCPVADVLNDKGYDAANWILTFLVFSTLRTKNRHENGGSNVFYTFPVFLSAFDLLYREYIYTILYSYQDLPTGLSNVAPG